MRLPALIQRVNSFDFLLILASQHLPLSLLIHFHHFQRGVRIMKYIGVVCPLKVGIGASPNVHLWASQGHKGINRNTTESDFRRKFQSHFPLNWTIKSELEGNCAGAFPFVSVGRSRTKAEDSLNPAASSQSAFPLSPNKFHQPSTTLRLPESTFYPGDHLWTLKIRPLWSPLSLSPSAPFKKSKLNKTWNLMEWIHLVELNWNWRTFHDFKVDSTGLSPNS